jgi:hypothetical protein
MTGTLRSLLLAGALLARGEVCFSQIFATSLTPDQVVPPSPSTASGEGSFELDPRNVLSFDIAFRDLHGGETATSIHGPAPAGSNADAIFSLPLGGSKSGTIGPLTPAQVADLKAGLWYVNIHTSHHGNGEIRGQIRAALAVEPEVWGRVKALYHLR